MYMKYVAAFQLREKMFYDDISHFYVLLVGTFFNNKIVTFQHFYKRIATFQKKLQQKKNEG